MKPGEPEKSDEGKASRWVAYLLDDLLRVPGTQHRLGLDPLIGLIPGVGDFLASGAGLTILAAAAKRKMPKRLYAKMLANWSVNALVGAIPFVGDIFSFWFKSNRRNYEMLRGHLDTEDGKSGRGGWWPMAALVGVAVVVLVIVVAIIGTVWTWVAGQM